VTLGLRDFETLFEVWVGGLWGRGRDGQGRVRLWCRGWICGRIGVNQRGWRGVVGLCRGSRR
jgi:hypothetical protein